VPGAERFEELIAWQKARELTRTIYKVTSVQPLKSDRGLVQQMQRAAVSVMSNLAEGFDRGSTKEFHHFVMIAKGSCAEVLSLLYVTLDAGYINDAELAALTTQTREVSRLVGGLRASLARRKNS
jgi:four helix bundle protein